MAVNSYSPRANRPMCEHCGKRPVKTGNTKLCHYCQSRGDTEPTGGTFRSFPKYSDAGKERWGE